MYYIIILCTCINIPKRRHSFAFRLQLAIALLVAAMARRLSLQNVRLPPNLLKGIEVDRMRKLNEDEVAFTEFLDGLDLQDVSEVFNTEWVYMAGRRRACERDLYCVIVYPLPGLG